MPNTPRIGGVVRFGRVIEVAQCSQCEQYVFAAMADGFKAVCDPKPLGGLEDIRAALIGKRDVYEVFHIAGKPHHMALLAPRRFKGFEGVAVASHDCGAAHRHAAKNEVMPLGPLCGPVSVLQPSEAPDRHPVSPRASQSRTADRAQGVSPRRSEPRPGRCSTCRKVIRQSEENIWAIEYEGRLVYAQHVQC